MYLTLSLRTLKLVCNPFSRLPTSATMASHASQSPPGGAIEMTSKQESDVNFTDIDTGLNHHDEEFNSTSADAANMRRMGKDQQLVRRFRVLSMASFVAVATAAWEFAVFNLTAALTNGGVPMLVYAIMWQFVGFFFIYMSMSEMASMAPIAGAQYHWVSEFAPESLQRGLSYLTGYVHLPL